MNKKGLSLLLAILLCSMLFLVLFAPARKVGGDTQSSSSSYPMGDFNHDGKVDFNDIVYFINAYTNYNEGKIYDAACDLNHDGQIDFNDIILFINAYNDYSQSLVPNASTPTPAPTPTITPNPSSPNLAIIPADWGDYQGNIVYGAGSQICFLDTLSNIVQAVLLFDLNSMLME